MSLASVHIFGTPQRRFAISLKSEGITETDAKGRFSFSLSYPPVSSIWVSRRGYAEKRLAFDINNPAPADVEIRLQPEGAGVFGLLIDQSGRPIKDFTVIISDVSAAHVRYVRSFHNGGRFSIVDIPAGIYSFEFEVPRMRQTSRLERLEIRQNYLYGEILVQLPPNVK